jgi:hypothetical protein
MNNWRHRRSEIDCDPGFTVIGIPPDPKRGDEKKEVKLSRAYGSRSAAELAKRLLDGSGAKDTWIKEVGRPST